MAFLDQILASYTQGGGFGSPGEAPPPAAPTYAQGDELEQEQLRNELLATIFAEPTMPQAAARAPSFREQSRPQQIQTALATAADLARLIQRGQSGFTRGLQEQRRAAAEADQARTETFLSASDRNRRAAAAQRIADLDRERGRMKAEKDAERAKKEQAEVEASKNRRELKERYAEDAAYYLGDEGARVLREAKDDDELYKVIGQIGVRKAQMDERERRLRGIKEPKEPKEPKGPNETDQKLYSALVSALDARVAGDPTPKPDGTPTRPSLLEDLRAGKTTPEAIRKEFEIEVRRQKRQLHESMVSGWLEEYILTVEPVLQQFEDEQRAAAAAENALRKREDEAARSRERSAGKRRPSPKAPTSRQPEL